MRWVGMVLVLGILVLAGCTVNTPPVSPPPSPSGSTETIISETNLNIENSPGDAMVFCNAGDEEENQECFESVFATCQRVVGTFWETSDDVPLAFESRGLDDEGNCRVRVTVLSDSLEETPFAGQSSTCLVSKSPAMGERTEPFFDAYSIGPSTCTGSYVDAIQKGFEEPEPTDSLDDSSPEPLQTEPDSPAPVSFSILVNEGGVDGTSEFTMKKGAAVTLTITVDVKDVSFNGEQVIGPAEKGLPADQYIFNSGHLLPGKSVTVDFVANESFEFGVYWPGPSVLKGKGKFTVEEN